MTADEARAMYRDMLDRDGEDIAIRRYSGSGPARPYIDRSCRARVLGYAPEDLVGSITQGDRKIIVMAEDLAGYSPAFVVAKTDKAIVRGAELAIVAIDDSTRRLGGDLIAYELQARG